MNSITFASIRLGKTSVAEIKHLNAQPQGLVAPFTIKVVCTQVPQEFDKGVYVFVWLGSDNSKGIPTEWKQGYKAFGVVESVAHGERYNDESTTIVKILYVFPDAVNRLDFLKYAPEAYYYCSALPIIGLDDHSNQTIRLILADGERGNISSMFYALRTITDSFYTSLIQIDARLQDFFDFVPPSKKKTLKSSNLPRQIIYYGAPGTGKSNRIDELTNEKNRIRTTFHPDSDYSTFVGAYKPTMKRLPRYNPNSGLQMGEEEKIVYSFVPQAFLKAYVAAWKRKNDGNEEPFYLVIEEINRGNCAQIFGDLFQLLDRDETGQSKYAICPDDDIQRYLGEALNGCDNLDEEIRSGKKMLLPPNLYIWATMNTSDQSLFPIDSAFKRRWDWEYMPIEDAGKGHVIEIGAKRYDWWKFVSCINDKIGRITNSEDKKLGYWFVTPANGGTVITAKQFVSKVLFYLWNDVYKDYAESSESIFKITDENGAVVDAPFTSFFGKDAEQRLQGFMAYNGIEPITDEE